MQFAPAHHDAEKVLLAFWQFVARVTVPTQPKHIMARHASKPRLQQNAFGYYTIVWTDNGRSKRISTATKDHTEAATFYANWLRNRHLPSPTGEAWNVSSLLDIYFDEQIDGGPSHERTAIIVANLKHAFGTMSPELLDASAMLRYSRERAQGLHGRRTANDSTVRRELTVLIACLNHAVRQRRMPAASFPHIARPSDGEARDVVIPTAHMELILSKADGRLLDFVIIAFETASRREAVESLCWRQVDLQRSLIDFSDGKRRSVKRRVAVPMSTRLKARLSAMRGLLNEDVKNDFVLGSDASVYPAWVALMQRLAKETGNAAFNEYTPHDLRRTWATNAARRGVSLFDIAGMLGDSVSVVTKHYAKHHPDYLRGAVQ
jgi:integrase